MSDFDDNNEFDTASDSYSDSDLSIFKDLEELERQLHNTHLTLHTSIETLENIHVLVISGKNINVRCGGIEEKCDFDEVLEKIHAAEMAEIEASKGVECGKFSDRLLKAIEECEFCA